MAKPLAEGRGFEYKSDVQIGGIPLLHISFKYRHNGAPVVARGIIAIGQFAVGIVTIAQFGLGIVSISQLTVSVLAVAQIAIAYTMVAQVGIYIQNGIGQAVVKLADVLKLFS